MLDALFNNASEVDAGQIQQQLTDILIDGEKVWRAFKLIRDVFVFTNLRLVLIDYQGISGKKVEYHSIPYKSITHFAVETAGRFDRDSEIKIWITGGDYVEKEIKKGIDVISLQKMLAQCILKP